MTPRDPQEEEFIHLVRLCWDLKVLGTPALLVSPTAGSPVLEIPSVAGGRTCVRVVRRSRGPVFTWRPPGSTLWLRGEWVWALDEHATEAIMAAVAT